MRIGDQLWIGEEGEIQQPPLELGASEIDPCDMCGATGRNAWISADQHHTRFLDIYLCAQCLSKLSEMTVGDDLHRQPVLKVRINTALGARRRFLILRRDNYRCCLCGATGTDVQLHVDHRIAKARGGTDESENLWTLCQPCNLGKGVESL